MATETATNFNLSGGAAEVQRRWQEMPPNRRLGVLVALAAVVAILIAAIFMGGKPSYKVLYTNLSDRDGGQVIAELQKLNVPYQISDGGAVISVPANNVYATRMKLAADGLPKGAGVGFALLDHEPMGTSDFVEHVNYQRALEGSLERTIASLSSVQGAKVHLAMPKPSVFLSEQEKPTASVMLDLYPGRELSAAQVAGIVHLVAASVPGLQDKNVTVVDQHGHLLSSQANADTGLQPSQLAYQRAVDQQYEKRIQAILTPIVGAKGVRVAVSADIDFAKSESSSVSYGKGQILSQQTQTSSGTGGSGPYGVPGALSNTPPGVAVAPLVAPVASNLSPAALIALAPTLKMLAPTQSSAGTTTNYDVDKTIVHTVQPVGTVKRLSVAVLVDDQVTESTLGAVKAKPLSTAQLAQIQQLVEDAIGYSAKRGDTVKVVNMPFTTQSAASTLPWWQQSWFLNLMNSGLRYLVILFVAFLLYFGVVRPLLKRRLRQEPAMDAVNTAAEQEKAAEASQPSAAAMANAEAIREQVSIPGNPLETDLYVSRQLVMQDPARAAQVVKEWLSNEHE
ncbi:flagellar basal-body MS-ring/collar protein FliF [Acidithiobacillus montserratensis]|uniref:Flagellar basal-body MS-ring/collar protein FliF n=1 Tax=Acidithiobacillus montserratensis TaxID=2729135 RepID=A0ACD5HIF5_9PROT|nr:flagellar basal-body MS-ring/collar protein FliF [Acidithiobacillus montserratensis]MBN2680537.1 flagellar M-ring protein FliF [Acidithiobacillaceae bacterium]MBU2747780.1 flagellar M-ring protein FliF [Acidithiobacillus montserratensis]